MRWRTLDVHGKRTFLESAVPRIVCGRHGKITAAVPWARHDDRFSRPFEEFAAWKAAHMPWTRAAGELRITWDALANITARVAADAMAGRDRLDGLRRIGIDEKSWGKGAGKFLVIVTDHDTAQVVWISEGRNQATVRRFFTDLGEERAKLLTHVSADGAEWIHPVVRDKAPQAQLCLDPFYGDLRVMPTSVLPRLLVYRAAGGKAGITRRGHRLWRKARRLSSGAWYRPGPAAVGAVRSRARCLIAMSACR